MAEVQLAMQVVLSMLQDGCSLPMRRTAVAAVAGLARSPFNRWASALCLSCTSG